MRKPRRLPATTTRFPSSAHVPSFIDTSLVRARAKLSDTVATEQMASDMREAAYREGGMTREGLSLLGYSSKQIDSLAPAARELADAQAALT